MALADDVDVSCCSVVAVLHFFLIMFGFGALDVKCLGFCSC